MAEKNNATCSICGNEYYVCLSCRDSVKANTWKIHTDTAEHYKVYQIIHGLSTGVYTKDEAKIRFKNVNLSDLDNFRPHIKNIINDVLREPVVKTVEKVKDIESKTDKIETTMAKNIKEPIVTRKRNYKVEAE